MPWYQRLLDKLESDYLQRFDPAALAGFIQCLADSLTIIILAALVIWITRRVLKRVEDRIEMIRGARYRRNIETISSLVFSTIKYVIYIVAALWILTKWGVPESSLTIGTAVLGGAIGFGSQGLVQDIITGLSILAEEQLAVGDYVEINGLAGAVEEVGLRVVKLRDHRGVQHVIFNRTIGVVSNFTKGYVPVVVDFPLQQADDAEAARKIASRVCQDLACELPYFTSAPEVEGVQASSTKEAYLRVHVRVLPKQESAIETLFIPRMKQAFAANQIELHDSAPRVVVISDLFKNAIRNVPVVSVPTASGPVFEGSV